MSNNWFTYNKERQIITVQVSGKYLKIDKNNVDISYFSGGPGGQNANRNLKGVQLIFRIPETFKRTSQKTQQIVTRVMNKRSLHHNIETAFQQLANKIYAYYYIPTRRRKTKIPRRSKEQRITNKKMQSRKKEARKNIDY